MKKTTRKMQIARRITALLLCLALVLGAIYLDGDPKGTEAADPSGMVELTDFTDTTYLAGKLADLTGEAKEYEVYSPSQKISFTLPAVENDGTYDYAWYADGDIPEVDTADTTKLTEKTPITVLSATNTKAVLCKMKNGTPADGETPAVAAEISALSTIEYKYAEVLELDVSANTTTKEVSINGTDSNDNADTETHFFYARMEMACEKVTDASETPKTEVSQVSGWGTKTGVITTVNAVGNDADGTYNIYKKVVLNDGNDTLIYFLGKSVTRDFDLNITGAAIRQESEGTEGTLEGSVLTLPTASPSEKVYLTFTSGDEAETFKVNAVDDADTTVQYSAENAAVEIPADATLAGSTKTYTIEITADGKRSVTGYTASISYVDPKPGVKITELTGNESKLLTDDPIYLNQKDANVTIKAEVKVEDENVKITSADLYDVTEDTVLTSLTYSGTDKTWAPEFIYTPSTIGEKKLKVIAYTDFGGNSESDVITTFYDPNAPVIDKIYVTQDAKETVDEDGKLAVKYYVGKDIVFAMDASEDAAESGLADYAFKIQNWTGTNQVAADATVTSAPTDDLKGTTQTVTVTLSDKAGNETTKTFTLDFYSDTIQISHEIKPALVNETDTNAGDTDIVYTIRSDAELTGLALSFIANDGSSKSENITSLTPDSVDADSALPYTYTYTRTISVTDTVLYKDIVLKATNIHNVVSAADTISILRIDLNSPSWDEPEWKSGEDADAAWDSSTWNTGAAADWYQSLLLAVTYKDADDGEVTGTKRASGVDAANSGNQSITDLKGAKLYKNDKGAAGVVDNGDGTATMILSVDPSKDESGTEVSFTIKDKAGNSSTEFRRTYYVDAENPRTGSISVDGMKQTALRSALSGDPKISYTCADNIKVNKIEFTLTGPGAYESGVTVTSDTQPLLTEKPGDIPLSEIMGVTTKDFQDGNYSIKLIVRDLAGAYAISTYTFTLDNTAPDVNILLDSEFRCKESAEKYTSKYSYASDYYPLEYTYKTYNNKAVSMEIMVSSDLDTAAFSISLKEGDGKISLGKWQKGSPGTITVKATLTGNTSEYEQKYVVSVKAADTAGNRSVPAEQTITIFVDTKAPVITLKANDSTTINEFYDEPVEVNFKVTDKYKDSEENKLVIKKTYNDGSGTTTETLDSILEGARIFSENAKYELTYSTVDRAGNPGKQTISFTVDTVKPLADIKISSPANAVKYESYKKTYSNPETGTSYTYAQYFNHNVDMQFEVTDDTAASITVKDNGTVVRQLSDFSKSGSVLTASYTASTEGEHAISIETTDKAGNASDEAAVNFIIDKTAPVVSTTLNGNTFSEGAATQFLNANATVGVTVSDAYKDEADLTRTVRMTPPGAGQSVTSGVISEGADIFSNEADYEVSFKAIDRAGNESTTRTVTFRVDKTAPQLDIQSTAAEGTSTEEVTVTYSVREAFYSDMTNAVVRVYKKTDAAPETLLREVDFRATGQNSSMSETFTEDGEYRFAFDATDKVGNSDNTNYTFLLDSTAPTMVLSGVKNYDKTKDDVTLAVEVQENFFKTTTFDIKGTKTDIDEKAADIDFSGIDPAVVNTASDVTLEETFVEDGIYDIKIKSADKVGNVSEESIYFTIDKTAPVIGDISKYDGVRLKEFVWDINEEDLVTDLTACEVTIYLDGTVYDGTTALADGSHVLRVTAVDELGNEAEPKEATFILDQLAPTVMISGVEENQQIEEATTINVSLQLDEDVLDSVTLNGALQGISNNRSSFTVETDGDYKLVVKAHDTAGNETEKELSFSFGKPFNWMLFSVIGGGILLLLIILALIIRHKSWSQKK